MPITSYKQRYEDAQEDIAHLTSLLDAFFTGNVPQRATMDHMILATWGRKRLEARKAKIPALLQTKA